MGIDTLLSESLYTLGFILVVALPASLLGCFGVRKSTRWIRKAERHHSK